MNVNQRLRAALNKLRSERDRLIRQVAAIETALSSDSEERGVILSLLTAEEQRALTYKFFIVPSVARVDPNRMQEPPFCGSENEAFVEIGGTQDA